MLAEVQPKALSLQLDAHDGMIGSTSQPLQRPSTARCIAADNHYSLHRIIKLTQHRRVRKRTTAAQINQLHWHGSTPKSARRGITVKALPALLSQMAGGHHLTEQGRAGMTHIAGDF